MRTVRRLLVAAFFVAALVIGWSFAHRNPDPVRLDLLFAEVSGQPLWRVVIAAFAAGAAAAGALATWHALRLSLTARRWRKVAGRLETEIHQLRNLPLGDAASEPPRGSPEAGRG